MRGLIAAMLLAWAAQGWAQEAPDVRLVVDVSGSMQQNDPNRLSGSAMELMVSLLPAEARSGLWTFGSEVANPLPSSTVDPAWRRRALALEPELFQYQLFTDIEQAVRVAAEADPASGERHLILLTDGVVDIPAPNGDKRERDAASRRRLLEELTPGLAAEGVVIHTIAFSTDVDLSLVEQMAQVTGGLATVAETPEALLRAFVDVLDRIFPVDQVPLDEGSFAIDERVDAFSALLFHGAGSAPLTLIGPDGERHTAENHPDGVQWQAQEHFDVIAVRDPAQGAWHIEGVIGEDSRINIESSLTLRTNDLPTTLYMGFETSLEAWVEDRGEPVLASDEAATLSLRAELRNADDELVESVQLQRTKEHFQGTLPAPEFAGNARLAITAESPDFMRQRHQAVNVLAVISARADAAVRQVELQAEHPRLDSGNTRIEAELQGDTLRVEPVAERGWQIALPELDPDIAVPLRLAASITLDGETRTIELPSLQLNADARTGLGSVRLDRQGPIGERLAEAEQASPDAEEGSTLADTLSDVLSNLANTLPQKVQSAWTEARPKLERYVREHRGDPLAWTLVAASVVLLFVVLLWRRNAAHRRRLKREEPNV